MDERRTSEMSGTDGFRFRVSDAVYVPLRGMLLRLKLLEGEPDAKRFRKGRSLRLRGPDGEDRVVTITGHSATGGRPGTERLREVGELDVVISTDDGLKDDVPVAIGWEATAAD